MSKSYSCETFWFCGLGLGPRCGRNLAKAHSDWKVAPFHSFHSQTQPSSPASWKSCVLSGSGRIWSSCVTMASPRNAEGPCGRVGTSSSETVGQEASWCLQPSREGSFQREPQKSPSPQIRGPGEAGQTGGLGAVTYVGELGCCSRGAQGTERVAGTEGFWEGKLQSQTVAKEKRFCEQRGCSGRWEVGCSRPASRTHRAWQRWPQNCSWLSDHGPLLGRTPRPHVRAPRSPIFAHKCSLPASF